MFGVQVAGGYPNRMVPTAEMLAKEIGGGVDFVDVNLVSVVDGLLRETRQNADR